MARRHTCPTLPETAQQATRAQMALAMPAVMCAPASAARGTEGRALRARAQPLAAPRSHVLAGASFAGAPRKLATRVPAVARRAAQRAPANAPRQRAAAVQPVAAAADGSAGKPSGYTVLVAEKLGKAGIDMLKAYGTVVEAFDMSQQDLCAKVSLCDALIVRSATKVRSTPGGAHHACPDAASRVAVRCSGDS